MFSSSLPNRTSPPTGPTVRLPTTLSRGPQKLAVTSAEDAIVGVLRTEAACAVARTGLQGVDGLAEQLVAMHERHGDAVLVLAKPIIEGYGNRVRSILDGLS